MSKKPAHLSDGSIAPALFRRICKSVCIDHVLLPTDLVIRCEKALERVERLCLLEIMGNQVKTLTAPQIETIKEKSK